MALAVAPGGSLRAVKRLPARRQITLDPTLTIADVAAAVGRGPLPFMRGSCLSRALATFVVCRWYGLEAALVVGVRRNAAGIAAHAWIEDRGVVVPDQDVAGFVRVWDAS